MMLSSVRNSSRSRFRDVIINLQQIEASEPTDPVVETPPYVKIMRGLYYVHLYAALEKTVHEVVELSIQIIKSHDIPQKHLMVTMGTIAQHNRLKSFKDCSYKIFYPRSAEIFNSIESDEKFNTEDTIFSTLLQNVWFKTIQEIFCSFGIQNLIVDQRVQATINEIVDKRNAVAHGRETPTSVGERHRSNVLRTRTDEVINFIDLFISHFEEFLENRKFVRADFRYIYIR